ncbi:lantibiotic dehydratase [Thermostaphylospora chromogena]|uniref:Thiopeptide-type bacteriocin biosynthesis domain-containing protein n=1 Tax=Thermostaphylospora chromogena TaxID=35622 RepID=A0A1H1H960_9ACTN|nr:lantibiotic dehydratase [Thermostaphylospora chromogena]SDR21668.1 thiopeptide-type bacteriocin biosynthesis domain-containing protein [Thermostaphylospora chromogena]
MELPRYEVAPTVMVRTPFLPVLPRSPEPVPLEAVWVASPSLARLYEQYTADPSAVPDKRRRRLTDALARYEIRARTRPTPFGLFSGVGAVSWGERLDLRVGPREEFRRFARLEFTQVQALVRDLEREQTHRGELTLYANPAMHRHAGRVFLYHRDLHGTKSSGETLSVRFTPPLEAVVEWAREPIAYTVLLDKLLARHPDVPTEVLRDFLDELIDQGLLLSTLRPTMADADPLGRLVAELGERSSPAAQRARRIAAAVAAYRAEPLGAGAGQLRELLAELGDGVDRERCVQVDMSVPISGTLPAELAEAARRALDALFRLSPLETTPAHLASYAEEFAERYGEREVPILELLDEHIGLGPPAGYANPRPAASRRVAAASPPHAGFLRTLAARAQASGALEVELTGEELARLDPPSGHHPPSVDMFLLLARTGDDWLAVLSPVGTGIPAGRAFGRFWHLDERLADHVRRCARHEAEAETDALIADIGYAHPDGHVSNLMLVPRAHAAEITLGATPADFGRHLPLSDIVVGLAGGRLYARSRTLGRRVLVRSAHMVTPLNAPNAVRLLMELSEQGMWRPAWDWGELAGRPALPRVRVGRIVLAPARWRLPERPDGTPDPDADLERWCAEWSVPRYVYAGQFDNRLLLDLASDSGRELLRQQMRKGVEAVEEALPGPEHAAARGHDGSAYMAEVVISLLADRPRPTPAPPVRDDTVYPTAARLVPPGRDWWYFKLYGPSSLQNTVLRRLGERLDEEWFFVRYADPQPHLRIRVRARGASPFPVMADLLDQGLVADVRLAVYDRELERYGGVTAMEESERVFCAETHSIIRLLSLTGRGRRDRPGAEADAQDLAALSIDTLLTGLGLSRPERVAVYRSMRDGYAEEFADDPGLDRKRLNREVNERKRRLRALLHGDPPDEDVRRWRAEFSAVLADVGSAPPAVPSLVHMHANRLGLTRSEEYRVIHRLYEVGKDILHRTAAP